MTEGGWKKWGAYAGVLLPLAAVLVLRWQNDLLVVLLLKSAMVLFGYFSALCDLRQKRIPNKLVLSMLGAWVLIMIPQLFLHTQQTLLLVLDGMIGAVLGGGLFLLVYFISRKGLGGGDVKLMAASGLYLGVSRILPAMLYGSVLAALVGLSLVLFKKIGRRDTIALAPFLFVGMLVTMLVQ